MYMYIIHVSTCASTYVSTHTYIPTYLSCIMLDDGVEGDLVRGEPPPAQVRQEGLDGLLLEEGRRLRQEGGEQGIVGLHVGFPPALQQHDVD